MLFSFEELKQYVELDAKDDVVNKICFLSAYNILERLIGYDIEKKECTEMYSVQDYKIIVDKINISKVLSIMNMRTKTQVENFTVDYANKTILIINPDYEGDILLLKYVYGYTKETFPNDLKESLIRLFIHKKDNLQKAINMEKINQLQLPDDIQKVINLYSKKRL